MTSNTCHSRSLTEMYASSCSCYRFTVGRADLKFLFISFEADDFRAVRSHYWKSPSCADLHLLINFLQVCNWRIRNVHDPKTISLKAKCPLSCSLFHPSKTSDSFCSSQIVKFQYPTLNIQFKFFRKCLQALLARLQFFACLQLRSFKA